MRIMASQRSWGAIRKKQAMSNWKKLSGENNWEGLLKPFDKSLCETLVHYCKRVEVVYDTLQHSITDPSNYGKPKYEEQELFSKVGLEHYTINNYVYGDSKLDLIAKGLRTWVGFVAVASDEGKKHLGRRDILISWRGTVTGRMGQRYRICSNLSWTNFREALWRCSSTFRLSLHLHVS